MEDSLDNILLISLCPVAHDKLVAGGLKLGSREFPFDVSEGYEPGQYGPRTADLLFTKEIGTAHLLRHLDALLAVEAAEWRALENKLLMLTFRNPDHRPDAERDSYEAMEAFTLFIEHNDRVLDALFRRELTARADRRVTSTVKEALSQLGYGLRLWGELPESDSDDAPPDEDPTGEPYYWRNGF